MAPLLSSANPRGVLLMLAIAVALTACTKQAPSPSAPTGAASPSAAVEQVQSPQAQPTSAATPSGPVNLLSWQQGTVLRSWPATSLDSAPESILLGQTGWMAKEGSTGPYEFVYELPTSATIQQLVLGLGDVEVNGQPQGPASETVHVAVSSDSATSGFTESAPTSSVGQKIRRSPSPPKRKDDGSG